MSSFLDNARKQLNIPKPTPSPFFEQAKKVVQQAEQRSISSGTSSSSRSSGTSSSSRSSGTSSSANQNLIKAQLSNDQFKIQQSQQAQRQAEQKRAEQIKNIAIDIYRQQKQETIDQWKKIKTGAYNTTDFILGGDLTQSRIQKQQQKLNDRIANFNELSAKATTQNEIDFLKAREREILREQDKINNQTDALAKTTKAKIYNFLNPLGDKKLTIVQSQAEKQDLIDRQQSKVNRMKQELATTKSNFRKNILKSILPSAQKELQRYKEGGKPIILTGDLPIVPLTTIPKGISQIKFLGTQKKLKNGDTIVKLAYKTSSGQSGNLLGSVKNVEGVNSFQKSVSGFVGTSGTKYYSSPTKFKTLDKKKFVGGEIGLSKGMTTALKTNIGKDLNVIKKIKTINQLSKGRVVVGTNKYKSGLPIKDFVSFSKVITKKDLNFIAGRSIANDKAKAEFFGLIKNLDKADEVVKIGSASKNQVSSAVNKLVNSMIGSVVATQKASGLTSINKISAVKKGLDIISSNPKIFTPQVLSSPQSVAQKVFQIQKSQVTIPNITQKTSPIVKTRQLEKQVLNIKQRINQLQKQVSNTKQVSRQQQISRQLQQQKTNLMQKTKQLLKLKQIQKQITTSPRISIPRFMGIPKVPFLFGGDLKGNWSSVNLQKPIPTYYVIEKVRGKFKKLFPKPLSLQDARDFAVYSIDNNLSKTAFFVPLGKMKQVIRPPKQIQNYFSKNSHKFRPYKIRFGKKKQLVNGFIEKRRFFQDTHGERRQLRSTRRPINNAQRKILLKRLEKARKIRLRNLKRR
jgi:hypothetical protein